MRTQFQFSLSARIPGILYIILSVSFFLSGTTALSQDNIRIATWNIEHLGSGGRGFSGLSPGNLPMRTEADLEKIAILITDLGLDLIAIQEVAITDHRGAEGISQQLDILVDKLGDQWQYRIGNSGVECQGSSSDHSMQNAFLWNGNVVRGITFFDLPFPNEFIGDKRVFDRLPFVGYFEALVDGEGRNDFLLVNVHLSSGQDNDENHLAAMVILEQNLKHNLKQAEVKESDRIILGDFNDNPYAQEGGQPKYSDLLYQYMKWKKYENLVTEDVQCTRMDANLSSVIDHILVNNSAMLHYSDGSFTVHMPSDEVDELIEWRKVYSDHFPLSFELKVGSSDDDADW